MKIVNIRTEEVKLPVKTDVGTSHIMLHEGEGLYQVFDYDAVVHSTSKQNPEELAEILKLREPQSPKKANASCSGSYGTSVTFSAKGKVIKEKRACSNTAFKLDMQSRANSAKDESL